MHSKSVSAYGYELGKAQGWTKEGIKGYTKDMTSKQGIWTAMILSGYAKRLGITVSEAAGRLLCGSAHSIE